LDEEVVVVVVMKVEHSMSGGQFDFVWLSARVEGPHGAYVWWASRNQEKYPPDNYYGADATAWCTCAARRRMRRRHDVREFDWMPGCTTAQKHSSGERKKDEGLKVQNNVEWEMAATAQRHEGTKAQKQRRKVERQRMKQNNVEWEVVLPSVGVSLVATNSS
jgi:hypothetical protein